MEWLDLETKRYFMEIKHISKGEFVQIIHDVDANPIGWQAKHQRPVLIDFYGTWCPPCQSLAPILAEVAEQYAAEIDVYKVDVDQEPELTALYNIRMVPTLLFARPSDSAPTTMLGVMGKAELEEKVKSLLLA